MILEGSKRGFLGKLARDSGILKLYPVPLIECLARMGLPQQGEEGFLLVARRPLALDFEGASGLIEICPGERTLKLCGRDGI